MLTRDTDGSALAERQSPARSPPVPAASSFFALCVHWGLQDRAEGDGQRPGVLPVVRRGKSLRSVSTALRVLQFQDSGLRRVSGVARERERASRSPLCSSPLPLAALPAQELASARLLCGPRPKRRRAAHAKGLAEASEEASVTLSAVGSRRG